MPLPGFIITPSFFFPSIITVSGCGNLTCLIIPGYNFSIRKEIIIDETIASGGVDIEISDPEGGEILKEMGPLAGINVVVFKS